MTYVIAHPCIHVLDRACVDHNAAFFTEPLPGAARALDSPGGAAKLGALEVDTPFVASHQRADA